jgi:flagellar hook-basal body complex protein FliE
MVQADQIETQFQLGNPPVSLEQTVLAGQKASLSFQAAVQVRNRFVQAYTEIMSMNV